MIRTVAVLAAAYKGQRASLSATRTHSFDTRTGETLCGKVNPDHLTEAPDEHYPADCPTCAKRDPRRKSHKNDGPFVLKSLFQF
jgi:hypothetical protein